MLDLLEKFVKFGDIFFIELDYTESGFLLLANKVQWVLGEQSDAFVFHSFIVRFGYGEEFANDLSFIDNRDGLVSSSGVSKKQLLFWPAYTFVS